MPGKFLKKVPLPHVCTPPTPRGLGVGTVWQCECDTIWQLSSGYNRAGKYWAEQRYMT